MTAAEPPVLAAGALLWKLVDGKVKVLLVHRTQHKDVSLPKGKLDPGETLPETAVREIAEETGLTVALGAPLGMVEYTLPNGRQKLVYYWQAEVDQLAIANSTFESNGEIEALEWVSPRKARKRLSYAHDVELIERFTQRLDEGRARTFAVLAVRHGKAVPHDNWDGPDATRPLMHRGNDQAASIAPAIAAYKPTRIVSSPATRCTATMAPAARLAGLAVKHSSAISQDAYENGEGGVHRVVSRRLAAKQSVVLCSHGPVLPDIVGEVARATNTPADAALRRAAVLQPGEYSVLHVSLDNPGSGIVAVETHGPAV